VVDVQPVVICSMTKRPYFFRWHSSDGRWSDSIGVECGAPAIHSELPSGAWTATQLLCLEQLSAIRQEAVGVGVLSVYNGSNRWCSGGWVAVEEERWTAA
jgi:hypothetical protein